MESVPPKSNGRAGIWLVLLVIVAAVAAAVVWLNANKPPEQNGQNQGHENPNQQPTFSRDESQKLNDLRNQAIGYLENHDFDKSEAALTELAGSIPDDPFVTRNLLICQQLALDKIDRQRDAENFTRVQAAAKTAYDRAVQREPDSHVPLVIGARVDMRVEQPDDALIKLRRAMELAPKAVGPFYDLYSALQSRANDKSPESVKALRRVNELEPHNLFVLKDWLVLVTTQHDQEFFTAEQEARDTIAPFADIVKLHTRNDPLQLLDNAKTAATNQNWPVAERSVTIFRNIVAPESARDKRYVALDSLEYILSDFSDETQQRLDVARSVTPSNPVHFLPPTVPGQWPQLTECRDVAVWDFDLNATDDLLILQANQVSAWSRNPDQTWSELCHRETGGTYSGLLACELDDDEDSAVAKAIAERAVGSKAAVDPSAPALCYTADPDLVIYGPSGLKAFENARGADGTRTLVPKSCGEEFDKLQDVTAIAAADFDTDGDVDLLVSTASGVRIFSNRGNWTFADITTNSRLPAAGTSITALAIVDWDKDTDIDVLIATASGAGLLENIRHGRMNYRELPDFAPLRNVASLQIGDFDGDAAWDIAAAGPGGAQVVMTSRTASGIVSVRQAIPLVSTPVQSMETGDFDNDGNLDLLTVQSQGATVWRGDGANQFQAMPQAVENWLSQVQLVRPSDVDRDGDLDLIVIEPAGVRGQSNQCQESDNPKHGWLAAQMIAARVKPNETNYDRRTNHINLGGLLEVKAGDRYQARIVTGPRTHVGLGPQRQADVARILWTNGIPANEMNPKPDLTLCIEQKLGGSCPYLYSWDGERFTFVTDLLWNAPLGLKFAERVVAPWREWEYLKIEGRQLRPVDHEYRLRVTAELWEAEYFDEITLTAVDHPIGTEIFTNEKVGPAEIAQPRIHTVQTPRTPIAAHDTRGRDVLPQLLQRDGDYTKTFDVRLAQGMTEEHFLELDLGEFTSTSRVMLYLTGWMYPGSTSLRVQLSQNPEIPQARPPAIYTPDPAGEWREAMPYMGFPGGKTKTIAVDVSKLFPTADHRLRIVSTMELFWDAAVFTVDDGDVEMRQTELKLVKAELRDRGGVSKRAWPRQGNGPDQFDYTTLVPGDAWPPMEGNFTRYGDIQPLLDRRDDHLVVLGAGDEMQLSFAEPEQPVPDGWVRDFVIYSVGWDKDADQNTAYGDRVEPLPFEGMTDYAHRDGEPRPMDPAYLEYLRTYQTRQQSQTRFWHAVRDSRRN